MADLSAPELSVSASSLLVLPLHVTEEPTTLPSSAALQLDLVSLSGADEGLADLQPAPEEEIGERRGGWENLVEEQKKLEYMACLGLVPPAVLEEIHRRQQLCKTEYGNWWDRLHSIDFCLVPKTESNLHSLHMLNCENEGGGDDVMDDYGIVGGGEDVTQVAPRPDAGALVEQITYLTSWPQTTPPDTASSVEIITQPSSHTLTHEMPTATVSDMSQTLREHYAGILTEREQLHDDQLQAALQHINYR